MAVVNIKCTILHKIWNVNMITVNNDFQGSSQFHGLPDFKVCGQPGNNAGLISDVTRISLMSVDPANKIKINPL